MADLDKGGAPFEFVNTYFGPTLGWVRSQLVPTVVPPTQPIIPSGAGGGGGGGGSLVLGSSPVVGGAANQVLIDLGGTVGEWSMTQLTAQLNLFSGTLKGLVPASGGGTTSYLRADGTWAPAAGGGGLPLIGTGATVTANAPLLDLSQTWNNSGVTFTGVRLNITPTANAGVSKIIDFQVGGVSTCWLSASGRLNVGPGYGYRINNSNVITADPGNNNYAYGSDVGSMAAGGGQFNYIAAVGVNSITSGTGNTCLGVFSGSGLTAGGENALLGDSAGQFLSTGSFNVIIGGDSPGAGLTTENYNTIIGDQACGNATGCNRDIYIGVAAGANCTTTGGFNVGIGRNALPNLSGTADHNICIGDSSGSSITTGRANTVLGNYAGTAAMSGNIVLSDGDGNVRARYASGGWTFSGTLLPLTGTGATVTTSQPLLDLSQTWNAGAVAFTGMRLNVTNTASAAGSRLVDFQTGGVSQVSVNATGQIIFGNSVFGTPCLVASTDLTSGLSFRSGVMETWASGTRTSTLDGNALTLAAGFPLTWNIGGASPAILNDPISPGNTLRIHGGFLGNAGAVGLMVYNTYTNTSNYERAIFDWTTNTNVLTIGVQAAGTGTLRSIKLVASDIIVQGNTATPAGGSSSARLLFGTTAGFGIYYGSGAPTVSAAAGSIYIRTDNAGANLRLYSNTTGSTTWAAITSA